MRILVQCPSGQSRLLQVDNHANLQEVKRLLEEQEGIPVHQQVLCHAGQELLDDAPLSDYNLQAYTLSAEVVLYLSRSLTRAKRIFLTTTSGKRQQTADLVEADMPVGDVMDLLVSRGLATQTDAGHSMLPILVRRQDGSTVPIAVDPFEALDHLEARLTQQEGIEPSSLTFYQARDGSLVCTTWPSAPPVTNTYPVYQRQVAPQQVMPRLDKSVGPGFMTCQQFAQELCVAP